jgi:hypothetical protein
MDLQHQKTLKQTKILDNNTTKGLTNINKEVRLSTKQHSSADISHVLRKKGISVYLPCTLE